ncbi:MAG: hypothetical protein K9H49_17400 [Bacteroidales bacterium]|nr:hypothetical protein [Bacteroidales bacterium]MCF8390194.1 hypothetical protein [Bacteroidales bacterium]
MRKLCFIIVISSLFIENVYNQFTCEIITDSVNTKTSGVIVDYLNYIPDDNTPMKSIRLNFHFMLLETTHPDSPGNYVMI